ncbi:topoisomerase IV [Methanobrevibacter sp.]
MKDSKEKEHRISNLKDMITNINEIEEVDPSEELEEDAELINYLNEDNEYDNLEIDDEFIYRPGEDNDDAINLEDASIDEDFIINAPKEEIEDSKDNEEFIDDFTEGMSESFDNIVNAKIGRTPILAIVSAFLGLLLIAVSAFVFSSRSDRVIDNVVSGETNFISVIFLAFGLLFLIYGAYKILGIKNPLEGLSNKMDSVENDEKKESSKKTEPVEKVIPKSNIPLDKESYKIGEFNLKDIKNKLKRPSQPKKPAPPTQEELDKIPPAREKSEEKKGLTADEIEEMEYKQAILDNESIDDIFAEVEGIDELPIHSVDGEDKK